MNNVVKNSKTSSKKSITAKQLAKSNLTKRKNPDWDNLDRGYRYLTLDMKLPHDQAIAVMGNVVEESLGNYKATLKNGNGKGLIQWDEREVPNGRYGLWGSIWASVAKPANVYDATTDTMKNYWAPWRGLKGDKVRLEFIKAPLKQKTLIYAESYLRPGKPRIADRQLSAMQLDSIYNPRIKNIIVQKQGGQIRKMQTAAGGPIHYSRAMTANNLSKAANYVGEYILKGLGALGKIMTTPLTGGPQGTTSVVLPKTKKLLDAERKIREIQELLIGRVSTWLSPLNYGAALTTGNGLNAKKGEEEVASWSPAWQAVGRLGELYVGPKAIKGVKATPRIVVNTVAKAGSKTAKKVAVAREIKLGIKLNTKNGKIEVSPEYFKAEDKWYRLSERPEKIGIEEQGKNITTHDDPEIPGTIGNWRSTMLDNRRGLNGKGKRIVPRSDNGFVLEEGMNFAKHGQAHGNTSQAAKGLIWGGTFAFSNRFPGGIIEGQAPNKIFRGMTVEGKDSRSNFVLLNWEDVPIGARVGFHTGEMPMENLGWFLKTKNGTYTYESIIPEKRITYHPTLLLEPSTSLAFFERRPSKISEAESLGFGRSRGFNSESGSDLHEFYKLLDRRQTILDALRKLKAPEDMGVDETISKNSGSIIEDGYLMSNGYRYIPVTEKHFSTGTNMSFGRQGIGGSGHNYGLNLGGESTRVKDLGADSKIVYSAPKANLNRKDPFNLDVVITAENNEANKRGIKLLTKGMRDMESGAEFSGDASSTTAAEALSSWLRLAKNKTQLRKTAMSNAKIALDNNAGISLGKHTVNDPIHEIVTENATMSPDAYSYLYRTVANNPDKFHLGYTMKAGNFNSFARNPKNAYMYDIEQNYLDGLITPQEYIKLFNSWSVPLGGRKAYFYNGQVYKPQPFLIRNKQGGKMNVLEFLKNGGQVRKMQTASGGPIINGGTPFSITVKGKDRRPAWKRMYLNPNLGDTSEYYNGNILEGLIGLTPGVGDAIDAVKAADAVNNKDYTTAGFLGAGLLLPNIVEKPLKFARGLYKGYKANKMMKPTRKALDETGEKLEVDAFKSGSKPMYVTPAKGAGSDYIDVINDELKDSKYFDLERPFGKDETLTLRYYVNEDKLKQIIGTYKDFYKNRLGLYTDDVDKIYNHIISNPKLLDLNVNHGTSGLLDIIGVSLGYGPKDAILFKIGYNGLNMGEKVSKEAIESMKAYGYDRTLPGIYNILKKNIERGTLGVKSTNANGSHVGFGYVKNKLGGMLQLLKNGSGIHIKKKNRGKYFKSINKYVNV